MFWSPERFLLDPQSLNAYSYARNNPIMLSDSNGQSWIDDYVNFQIGQAVGVATSAVDTVVGLASLALYTSTPYMITHPRETEEMIRNIPNIPGTIWQDIKDTSNQITSGDPYEMGVGVGKVKFEIALALVGGFGSKAAKTTAITTKGLGTATRFESILKPGGRWIGTAGDKGIRILPGGEVAARDLYTQLAKGGINYNGVYKGSEAVQFNNGNFVGFRTEASKLSADITATIDVKMNGKVMKFKFQ